MKSIILLFVVFFSAANALKCYHCVKENCTLPMDKWVQSNCGISTSGTTVCAKLMYKDKDAKDVIERKCAIVSTPNKCQKSGSDPTLIDCNTCTEDLCNAASSTAFVAIKGFFGVLVALLAGKFMLLTL